MATVYHRFSQRFSQSKSFICAALRRSIWERFRSWGCQCVHRATYDSATRVSDINAIAPGCLCERCRMSVFSTGRIAASERLVRFAFHPIHFTRRGALKPSIFSHAATIGCSVQREDHAADGELIQFVTNFLEKDDRCVWHGVLIASCQNLREIKTDDRLEQAICIYDTAEKRNPAHGEFGWSSLPLSEGDDNELRAKLMAVFGGGAIIPPSMYRSGAVFRRLRAEHQNREKRH